MQSWHHVSSTKKSTISNHVATPAMGPAFEYIDLNRVIGQMKACNAFE